MTLSNEIQTFLDSQIEYYTNEAKAYREMAKEYNLDDSSVSDTAFGIIVGCIYSSFIQIYTNQDSTPNSQDVEEFTKIIVKNSKKIKESILADNDSKLEQ
jgi:predicted secreted protein